MQTRPSRARGQQAGSIPLALLALIMVSGLMAVLVANTVQAQRQVLFDREFHGVLPVADAGVETSLFLLDTASPLTSEAGVTYERHEFPVGETTAVESLAINEEIYTWTITRSGAREWEVDSQAEIDDTRRRVVATIEDQPAVALAAWTDGLLTFSGGNTADSYNSDTRRWCTRMGVVGSNDDVVFSGGADSSTCDRPSSGAGQGRTVDRVQLYDWDENPGAVSTDARPGGTRCDGDSNHQNCREIAHAGTTFEAPRLIGERLDLATADQIAFISDAIDACKAAGTLEDFQTSADPDNQILHPAPNAAEAAAANDMGLAGGHYCFENINFDLDTRLAPTASTENPVIIFVEKEVILKGQGGGPGGAVQVGCADCPSSWQPGTEANAGSTLPEAGALRIFVLEGAVSVGNQAAFAGLMYAPRADCSGSRSSAQADLYGSLICETMRNQGGWRFHYDEALLEIGSGDFMVARWREERPQ